MKIPKSGPRKKTPAKKTPPKAAGPPSGAIVEDSPKTPANNEMETAPPKAEASRSSAIGDASSKTAEMTPAKADDATSQGVAEASSTTGEPKPSHVSGERVTKSNIPSKQITPIAVDEAKGDDTAQTPASATAVTGDTKTTPTAKLSPFTTPKSAVKKSPAKAKSTHGAKAVASKGKQKEAVVIEVAAGGNDAASEKDDSVLVPKDDENESKATKESAAKMPADAEGTLHLVDGQDHVINAEEHDQVQDNQGSHFNSEEDAREEVEYDEQEGFQEPDDEGEEGFEPDEEAGEMEEEHQIQMSEIVKERKQKKELEIFVGGLDRDAAEEDVRKAFEGVGEVVEVRLHKDFLTNKNKGFAFVKFATKEQANRALYDLKFPMIKGKRCGIAPSEDNDTLFLGNICNTWTKEAVKQKLKDYGIDGVESITLVADTQNEGLSRGFAFLEFSCHADAMNAYKRLQKPDVIFGHPERTAKVAFAEPVREPDAEIMAQVKSVFVDGLPPHWDEDRVKEQLKSYGEIERVVLARNMPTAKRKDFGFVNFTTHEAAVACITGLNNTELGDEKMKMKTKARLANPLPKTQAVKGGMRGGFRIGQFGMAAYPRFRRGFGIGRHPFQRGVFHQGRGFFSQGRGRGGRFSYANFGADSRGRHTFGWRGGRRGSFRASYEGPSNNFESRRGSFNRGRGRPFASRMYPYPSEEDFDQPYAGGYYGEGSSYYTGAGRDLKRPFSSLEHESGYMDVGRRIRPRYNYPDPLYDRPHYQDHFEAGSGSYSRDYHGPDLGSGGYSSYYGGDSMGGGYYY